MSNPVAEFSPTPPKSMAGSAISNVFNLCVTTYVMLFIVNGAIPQLEMLLMQGRVPISGSSYTILAAILLCSAIFFRRFRPNKLLHATLALTCYAVLDFVFLSATSGFTTSEIRISFSTYVIPIVVVGLAGSIPFKVKRSQLQILFAVTCCACIPVSLFQYFTNSAIVSAESIDGRFMVPSEKFGTHVRAFSLFTSGLDAGIFYCLMAALGTSLLFTRRKMLPGAILLGAGVFGCYATYTRLTMIGLLASIASVIVLRTKGTKFGLAPWLPIAWAALAAVVILQAGSNFGIAGREDLTNLSTMATRLNDWRFFRAKFISGNTAQILLGTGLTSYSEVMGPYKPATSAPIPIDSGYLEVLLHSGGVGLFFVSLFLFRAWKILLRRALEEKTSFATAAAALFSVLPFFAAMNDLLEPMWALLFLAMCTVEEPYRVCDVRFNRDRDYFRRVQIAS